ncbi:MAG: hypothetical protein Q7R91_02560 [bacterium]|nr:hypothetical protein [bacterium]
MREGAPEIEKGDSVVEQPERPTREKLEQEAESVWKSHEPMAETFREIAGQTSVDRKMNEYVDTAIRDLRNTAKEPNHYKNPDSVAKSYPGWEAEDFEDLAKILEAKKIDM